MKRSWIVEAIIGCSLVYLIVIFGCSAPAIQIARPLSDSIKTYETIKFYGNIPGMKNTGIYLDEGDRFSILATGSIDLWPGPHAPLKRTFDGKKT